MKVVGLALLAVCLQAADLYTGWWRGQQVVYRVVHGMAVAEGDILLGTAEELAASHVASGESKAGRHPAIARTQERYLWPDGVIPYSIDPALPNQNRVTEAVEHWNTVTPVRLVERTDQVNYVRFTRNSTASLCSSFVGMNGREQAINLGDNCTTGAVIHEIAHAAGLFHEQSRADRDFYVRFLPENMDKREITNFSQLFSAGRDMGAYDYSSIMHYDVTGFSRNGRPVLQTVPEGIPISQRERLSPGDLDAIRRLYRAATDEVTISSTPFGLDVEVDGVRVKTPHSVRWAPGSVHTIGAPGPQTSGAYRYVFGRWNDEGPQTHTVTHTEDRMVYAAHFVKQYRLPLGVAPANGGSLQITPASPDGWYAEGSEIEIRAVPRNGYSFRTWAGFGAFGSHGESPNPLRVVVRGPSMEYTANFTTAPVTVITSEPAGLKVLVDGQTVTTPRGVTWTAGSTHTVEVRDTTQTTGDTARHYFQEWSTGSDRAQTITAGAEPATYVARFRTQHRVTVTNSAGGRVDVSPIDDGGYQDAGTILTLRPSANGSNVFFSWTGDATGSDNPGSIEVNDQKVISATFGTPGQILNGGIVNGASFGFTGGLAAGSIITIFGLDLGPGVLEGMRLVGGRADTTLSGTRVLIDNQPAPLVYVSRTQIAAVVPWSVAGRSEVTVRVTGPNANTVPWLVPVQPANPALFTANSSGRGPVAALNQDGSVNTRENPAPRGSVVVLYGTGGGQTDGSPADGSVTSGLERLRLPVLARIGGKEAPVHFAGSAPGLVSGVVQFNLQVPDDIQTGALPVVLRVGDAASAGGTTIYVQ